MHNAGSMVNYCYYSYTSRAPQLLPAGTDACTNVNPTCCSMTYH